MALSLDRKHFPITDISIAKLKNKGSKRKSFKGSKLKTHRACRARRCALGPRAIKSIARGPDTKLLLQREDPTPIARVPDAAARELVDTRVRQANAVDAHVGHGGTIFEFEEVSTALTPQ